MINAATNGLAVAAGVVWVIVGFVFLTRAHRAEASVRVLLGFGLVATGGLAMLAGWRGYVDLVPGLVLCVFAGITVVSVCLRAGRRAVGLSGWGLTRPDRLAGEPETMVMPDEPWPRHGGGGNA